jgi:predicted signal transduction protein with EAL and GGDEF domain
MAERTRNRFLTATRTLAGITLLLIGGIHYQQYRYAFYSAIPAIGPLFLLNFISGTALGLALLVPGKSRFGRLGNPLEQLTALAGIFLAASGLGALLISENTPLFGFMEHGYRFVIVLTISSEAVAIVLLTLFLVLARFRAHGRGAAPTQRRSAARAVRRTDQPTTRHAGG